MSEATSAYPLLRAKVCDKTGRALTTVLATLKAFIVASTVQGNQQRSVATLVEYTSNYTGNCAKPCLVKLLKFNDGHASGTCIIEFAL